MQRSFRELSDEEVADIEKASALTRIGWTRSLTWDELLLSKRVLIVSEAGAGKTFECQVQQAKLWNGGEAAFFLDLATLAVSSVREMLSEEEEARLDTWLRSQSDIATFFLDSIDELKLTHAKFDQALKRFSKALAGQLGRTRIVITTRPVPIDRELIARNLPIPASGVAQPTAEAFADVMMDRRQSKPAENAGPIAWRNVGLMPLSLQQMHQFVLLQGVSDPDALLADIKERDAEEFAERPQDLVELCSDWREHQRIRSHREQVTTNVATKLRPSSKRHERADLSQETAIEGASRLALAAMLVRKLTLRHSADSDRVHASEAALDASRILQDWGGEAVATLLERPLFGFASYGRVRFHHRSVVEFLAAERLKVLLSRGVSIKSVKRLLFTKTAQGTTAIRPSMRTVAAWLALSNDAIFDDVIMLDPAVVLDHGDPQSLRPEQRIRALEAYVHRYGRGGWRGLSTPSVQVHRFASNELTDSVNKMWSQGIENPEVRDLILEIIAAGKLSGCTDICYAAAMDNARAIRERSLAIEALLRLDDPRCETLSISVESDSTRWPQSVALHAIVDLFPTYMPVLRLSQILRRVREKSDVVGDLRYRLPRSIATADLSSDYLDELRQALADLIVEEMEWDRLKFPRLRTKRPDLMAALIAACRRQRAEGGKTASWITSCQLAIRLSNEDHDHKESLAELRGALAELSADERENAFWEEAEFLVRLHKDRDAWDRVYDLSQCGGIQLNIEKDAAWVRKRLSNPSEPLAHREMMLWAEMLLLERDTVDHSKVLECLRPSVADAPSLEAILDERLQPRQDSAELRRMEMAHAKRVRNAERRAAKDHASWVLFWREVTRNPEAVFSMDRADSTAWNLWRAMAGSGGQSRASGWSRRFIEAEFGEDVATRLRDVMMAAWRKDKPTLRSERPDDEKDTFFVSWQFGLAGVAAEAEDRDWAKRLSAEEAALACRYAPLELNGFPSWLESLAIEHPLVVDQVLGEELSLSLLEVSDAGSNSMELQNIRHASAIVATLFVPRVRTWLADVAQIGTRPNNARFGQHLRQAIEILVKNGTAADRHLVETTARERMAGGLLLPQSHVWLSALLQLNPANGVDAIARGLAESTATRTGVGVQLFAGVLDRDHGGGLGVDLKAPEFTPTLLLRLLRIAYQHVQICDDARHEGSYSPDMRDNAENGRNAVLSALLSAKGPEGWAAKLEMASDPLFAHFKDRAIALAQEMAANEADSAALTEEDFCILDKTGEAPPSTSEAMFALMRDRLDDIDDLLLQDISPRELWAKASREHLMRRELARALSDRANQNYTVDQESVTADEKETDIRLRSTGSGQQAVIELKLGDERTGADLFNTIRDQLLTKYMAADECRAGCLLVTIAKDRRWDHPETGEKIEFEALMALLNSEAERLSNGLGGAALLMAKGLDLRPRLKREAL